MQIILLVICLWVFSLNAHAEGGNEYVVVAEFVEMHTGPAEGFPIFHASEKGEILHVFKRKNQWFQVEDKEGRKGWVEGDHLAQRLFGAKNQRRNFLYRGDKKHVSLSYGILNRDGVFALGMGYRIMKNSVGVLNLSKVVGDYSNSLILQPEVIFSASQNSKLVPELLLGYGLFWNQPRSTLVDGANSMSSLLSTGAGLKYNLSESFSVFSHLKANIVLADSGNKRYWGWQSGFGTLF